MNDAPPPYTEIGTAVKAAFQADPEGARAALAKVLKEQSASVLVKQSNDLASTVKILKKSFENVSQSLVKIDNVVKDGGPRFPVWQKIYQDYKILIDETQEDAIATRTHAQLYLDDVLESAADSEASHESKIGDIDAFLKLIDNKIANAKDYKERFLGIRDRVVTFRSNLLDSMDNEETATLNAIKEVKKDIVDLENKLAYWRSMTKGALWFLGGGVTVGGAIVGGATAIVGGATVSGAAILAGATSVAAVSAAFAPVGIALLVLAALTIAISGITALTARIKANNLADSLAEKKRQLLDLEAQLASLKELRPIVERASVDMETIGDHLMILSDVWKAFRNDAQEVKTILEQCHRDGSQFDEKRVSTAVEMYRGLVQSMGTYASLVS
ncbi:hypothetical protein FFLO_04407 [Filobasidium floriforme]|uniref:Transmembrane protein n=1 Tax=Filobasidium floriforme TaxID=5210 RepID=A0A8K0NPA4_9TREE|nr:uncharacterized protein HD553DRAFT_346398 [Filobasidium floriforme]KAG7531346.1 hypothetical protein FFLO_04407 [Filobasidium floriforme]KAH8078017.1 hypothetical protein HD553DRAFT_346398 [Filobasidium floriforme]